MSKTRTGPVGWNFAPLRCAVLSETLKGAVGAGWKVDTYSHRVQVERPVMRVQLGRVEGFIPGCGVELFGRDAEQHETVVTVKEKVGNLDNLWGCRETA